MPAISTLAALPYTLGDLQKVDIVGALNGLRISTIPTLRRSLIAGNSSYHGLAAELTRRFSRGLLFRGAYTWSHNIDDSTADLFSTLLAPRRPEDFQNMGKERLRHRSWIDDIG